MILLYTLLVTVLGVSYWLTRRQVAALEKKYVRVAREADQLLRQPAYREGNSNRHDPYQSAKRQYQLGLLVQKRDRVEARYSAWQTFADRFGHVINRVRGWKGQKLPYTFGALDVWFVLSAIDYFGAGRYVNVPNLLRLIESLFTT